MLMVSISGTAVVAQLQKQNNQTHTNVNLSRETLIRLYQLEQFQTKLSEEAWMPKEEDWGIILNESMVELIPFLLKKYIKAKKDRSAYYAESSNNSTMVDNFNKLLDTLPYEELIPIVYCDWGEDVGVQNIYAELIDTHNLFNAEAILSKLSVIDKHIAISLLETFKNVYDKKDLAPMKQIIEFFDSLPDTGHYEEAKGGLFSKGGEVMVCERGHKTSVEKSEYCQYYSVDSLCGLNIKGIDYSEVQIIEKYKALVNILEKALVE